MYICSFIGHRPVTHLDYIYGTLPREHVECARCKRTTSFKRPSEEREKELSMGAIGDGAVPLCNASINV